MLADPLRVALSLGGALELLLPASGDGDDVPAAMVYGALAGEAGAGIQAPLETVTPA